jgi:hypothetical protein
MTRIISVGLCLPLAIASIGLRGLGRGGGADRRARLGVVQGLARFGFGVGGGEPGALLRGDEAGQRFEEVFEIFEGVQAVRFGGGDEAVISGTNLPAFSGSEEEVVLFAYGGGADLAFDGVVVDGQVPVFKHGQQVAPFSKRIMDGTAHLALRQVGLLAFVAVEEFFEAAVDRSAFDFSSQFYLFGAGSSLFEPGFYFVEQLDLPQDEVGGGWRLLGSFDKFPPNVREAPQQGDVFTPLFAHFFIDRIAVAHDVSAPVLWQEFFEDLRASAGGPVVIGADAGCMDDPQVALFCLAVAGAKVFYRCFVYVQEVAFKDGGLEIAQDATQPDFMDHDGPAAHGLARQVNAVAGFIDLFLPIKWQMIAIFTSDNIGEGAGTNVAIFLQGGQRGDEGDAGAGLGQVFDDRNEDGSGYDEFAKFSWGDVEQFSLFLADFTIGIGRCDDFRREDFALDDRAVWREDELGTSGWLFVSGGDPCLLWEWCDARRRWGHGEICRAGQGSCVEAWEQEFTWVHWGEALALLAVELLAEILYLGEELVNLLLLLRDGLQEAGALYLPRLALCIPRCHHLLPIGRRGFRSGVGRSGCHVITI